jgi:hypothetical protein
MVLAECLYYYDYYDYRILPTVVEVFSARERLVRSSRVPTPPDSTSPGSYRAARESRYAAFKAFRGRGTLLTLGQPCYTPWRFCYTLAPGIPVGRGIAISPLG